MNSKGQQSIAFLAVLAISFVFLAFVLDFNERISENALSAEKKFTAGEKNAICGKIAELAETVQADMQLANCGDAN